MRDAPRGGGSDLFVYAPLLPDAQEVSRILESGKNVVTPVGWFWPYSLGTEVVDQLQAACAAGEASLHGTGINPGGMSDRFPLMLSGLARDIRGVRIDEYSDIRNYDAPDVIREVMLMGKPPDVVAESPMLELLGGGFRQSIDMLAAALGVEIDGYATRHDLALATAPIEGRFGRIEPDTVAGQRFTWSGVRANDPVITTRVTWVMGFENIDAGWTFDREGWEIAFDADPPVRCRIETAWPDLGAMPQDQAYRRDHGIIATANHLVNAIPAVCDAPVGLRTYLDLALVTGRWSQAAIKTP